MTKDEIQKALNEIPKDGNYDGEYLSEWFYYHQKTVICALQSQLTKTEENVTCGDLSNIPEGWQWQDISTAPKDGRTICIFDSYSEDKSKDGYGVCTARWDYSLKWWIMHQRYSNVISLVNPTHWMPLPEPPQERKE